MARYNTIGVALLAGALLTAPAFAQDNTTGGVAVPDATTGTQTDTAIQPASPDAGTTASTGAAIDGQAALAAIDGAGDTARHLGTISAVSGIHVVRLSEFDEADKVALADAVSKNSTAISGLRSTLQANEALSAKLKESSVDLKSVVAAKVEADGAVTIFVN